jgi:signal transduction histidine kinase
MVLRDFTKEAELEKAKDLFLGMVSHELRTPMSAIQGYVDILLASENNNLSEAGYEYLQTIGVSIKQLLKLANELIDLSRMETGEIDLYPQWVDLTEVVQNAAKIVRQEYEARNLSLEIKVEDDLPQLYVDHNRLNQVLLNLLSNAYKYTPQGGAMIAVNQTDEWINIDVSDTGLGIKKADQEKMFERFFRANDRSVQRVDGVGLGLNISKGLIELHGGNLTFESQYGTGTTFTISLPKNNPILNDIDAANGKDAVGEFSI